MLIKEYQKIKLMRGKTGKNFNIWFWDKNLMLILIKEIILNNHIYTFFNYLKVLH